MTTDTKHWKFHTKFIDSLTGKSDEEIHKIVHENFPKLKCISVGSCFHRATLQMFKVPIEYEDGISNLQKLYKKYGKYFPKLTSRRKYLSDVRQIIKKTGNLKLYEASKLDVNFNMDKKERTELAENYKDQVIKKNKNKLQIDLGKIEEKVVGLSTSTNVYDKIILVLLCIGSRPKGVISENTYRVVGSQIEVSNLTKKREGNKNTTVLRPVLFVTAEILVKKWDAIRHWTKTRKVINKNGELSKNINNTLNNRVVKIYPWMADWNQKSSMLRKFYATISFEQYADKSKMNFNAYIQEKLSHESIMTSFSYSVLNIKRDDTQGLEELNTKLASLEIKYNMILNQKFKGDKPDLERTNKLEDIYEKNPSITQRAMKKASGMGSTTVSKFLKSKRA
jgi:hypothetical protein